MGTSVPAAQPVVAATTQRATPAQGVALETFVSSMTAYYADCPGCSGRVACNGRDVRSNIHFNDATFGTVRIIAAGRQFPCGTIMYISGIGHAIVLDRGSAVTGNVLDILMSRDIHSARQFGRQSLQAQVLRIGW